MVRLPILLLTLAIPAPARATSPAATIDSYVNAYYLAEGKLADFDAELDQAVKHPQSGFLTRSNSYRELIALRNILDETAQKIEQGLKNLPDRSPQLEAFRTRLHALDPAEKIAVSDLLPDLDNATQRIPPIFPSLDEERAFRRANQALMMAHIARSRRDRALALQVQATAATLDFGRQSEDRSAFKIQPSAGPEGNISGGTFPANTWALTYDDGPHPQYTPMVLANLAELKKKASFMWLAECLIRNPTMPAAARHAGMPTNDHSYTHENLTMATAADLNREITLSSEKDADFYGSRPQFFRLPYGAGLSNKTVRQLIADNGMIHVFWNVDSLDWKDKEPTSILARVQKEMAVERHGIILFHDIHAQSVAGSKLMLQWSATLNGTAAAHRWVTIPEIVDELNK
jgi:peptidoglycan/xylan/chitin deacetylase (PgdA/CDA1 family)